MKAINITGRKWFQKSAGNTYHSAVIHIDGKHVHTTGRHYGYDNQYLETAKAQLIKKGHIPDIGGQPLWEYCENEGIILTYQAVDVSREKDL